MSELVGNLLVAQSGGPTSVINASLAGVVEEAGKHVNAIEEIYGGLNGIYGILKEDLIDFNEESKLDRITPEEFIVRHLLLNNREDDLTLIKKELTDKNKTKYTKL